MRTPRSTGFSLVELLVSMTIVVVVIAAASSGMVAQNGALQAMDMARDANAANRDAMLSVESNLRKLGWGIDPRFAIDTQCAGTTKPCHDRVDGPDELVFLARNPNYRWRAFGTGGCANASGCLDGKAWSVASISSQITLNSVPTGVTFEAGRILQVVCAGGQNPVMVTVGTTVTGAGANLMVPLKNPFSFPYNDVTSLQSCHSAAGSAAFLVDKFRYYVANYSGRSWLMLDQGLGSVVNGVASVPPIPIAPDVDDFQVAYVLQPNGLTPGDTNNNGIVADDPPNREEPGFPYTTYASIPTYDTQTNDPSRATTATANVVAIRVSIILSSVRSDPTMPASWTGEKFPWAENRFGVTSAGDAGVMASGGRKRRYKISTEVPLRNQTSTRPFIF